MKTCVICGAPAKQKTCGQHSCKAEMVHRRAWAGVVQTKACTVCGIDYHPTPGQGTVKWARRQTCGDRRCSTIQRNRTKAAKPSTSRCPICNAFRPQGTRQHSVRTCGADVCVTEYKLRSQGRAKELHVARRVPEQVAPPWTIDVPRPEAIRSIVQACSLEFRRQWLESLPPPVRAHVGRVMAGMR